MVPAFIPEMRDTVTIFIGARQEKPCALTRKCQLS